MNIHSGLARHRHWYWIMGLALIPLAVAGLFVLVMTRQSQIRYDQAYFTPDYQELYEIPGNVARRWQEALQTGDPGLVAELTGLRKPPRIEPDPDVILTILLETDEAGYFHYMYFDLQTYERLVYYIKEVRGRWVLVPEDFYLYWDSRQWLGVFTPVTIVWWLVCLVAGAAISLSRVGARTRETMFGG